MVLSLLRLRSFFFLWLAQIGATLGNELYNVAVMVVIYERTGSTLQATGVLPARTLPPFLFSPLAGALVDRHNRQHVLVVMNLARVAMIAAVFSLNTVAAPSVWLIYCVVFGLSLADVFYKPAQMALIPAIAPRELLMRAL
jgi:MFS family permease